ncbi:hypothetical protein BRADI_2g13865v3 [Brachypodium distachyon]|uniref:Uncharacterized protein n=1 Tax=Brachypodium distachyon TaxID=15368 RepID=A0A0Q3IVL3_BRADI|nr:hypothetical protein BRADI_2g13865v3 [Brachypodium distachyon]
MPVACWNYLCPRFAPVNNVHHNIKNLRTKLAVPFAFEIITAACWSIWKVRNDYIFNRVQPSLYRCRRIFIEEMNLVFHRAKRKSHVGLKDWIDSFL